MSSTAYASFLASKDLRAPRSGVPHAAMHPRLWRHQPDCVRWALRHGRAALFEDTGLGKTTQQLEWARHVSLYTGKPVLVLAPLAVAAQTVEEAKLLDIDAVVARSMRDDHMVVVTNYQRLHLFDPRAFGGVVLDESSILKHQESKTRESLTLAFRDTPFKLACTATPSPNDWTELGQHAEFLGVMKQSEMLATFFYHDGGDTGKWYLKGHAEEAFWDWVCSWAILIKRPSDLGYSDDGYDLAPLHIREHIVESDVRAIREQTKAGATMPLFADAGATLMVQRRARRSSLPTRVKRCIEIIEAERHEQWLVWVGLNDEGKEVTDAIRDLGLDVAEVAGKTNDKNEDGRERVLLGFARGEPQVLVTKGSIAGFGMNWQRCARMACVSVDHSYEKFYQQVRRCWRFGQTREVHAHVIVSEAERPVVENLKRKQTGADVMSDAMRARVRSAVRQ